VDIERPHRKAPFVGRFGECTFCRIDLVLPIRRSLGPKWPLESHVHMHARSRHSLSQISLNRCWCASCSSHRYEYIADPRILSWWTETDLRTNCLHQSDAPLGLTWIFGLLTCAHTAWKSTSASLFFRASGTETVENLKISPGQLAPCQEKRIKRQQTVTSAGCKVLEPNAGFLLASMHSYCRYRPIEFSYSQSVSVSVPQDKIRGSAIRQPCAVLCHSWETAYADQYELICTRTVLIAEPLATSFLLHVGAVRSIQRRLLSNPSRVQADFWDASQELKSP